jgi:hypothetical protein
MNSQKAGLRSPGPRSGHLMQVSAKGRQSEVNRDTQENVGSGRELADVGAIDAGGPGPFRAGLASVAEAKVVLESLIAEVRLISDEKDQHRPAKDALQVAFNEFHRASEWIEIECEPIAGCRQIKFVVAGLRMATRGKADPSLRLPHE